MIKAIVTDFDGTLVDTFEANLRAYQKAFGAVGLNLTAEAYRECFGSRFERFMTAMGIYDAKTAQMIREAKMEYYPMYFSLLRLNKPLVELIGSFRQMGGKTAIASTARRENLMNVVDYFNISDGFDLIYTGADVKQGKPSPEIYLKAMEILDVRPQETLIFEDSDVGIQAGNDSGANLMIVSPEQFANLI